MAPEITRLIITVLAGTVGTLGFALVFKVERRLFALALICATISCLAYEGTYLLWENVFISSLIGSGFVAAYAYAVAYICKTPATVMIILGIIPLVPGSKLYYTMLGAVNSNSAQFSTNGQHALLISAGIALGVITVTGISRALVSKIVAAVKAKKEIRIQRGL